MLSELINELQQYVAENGDCALGTQEDDMFIVYAHTGTYFISYLPYSNESI